MTAEEGRWDEVEGDSPEQYYDRSELEQARAKMEAEKHMLDLEEDLFKKSDIGFDYQEGGEYDPIGEPDIFDTDGQKFIDMFGKAEDPEEAEEDVSVGGPPAGDTIPANGLYIDDEEEIPAEEAGTNPEESWNLLSDYDKEAKFGDWLGLYSDDEDKFAQNNYGKVSYDQLPPSFKAHLGGESRATETKWECLDCDSEFDDAGKHQEETGHHNIMKKANEEQINSDTYYYDYSDYWNKGDSYVRSGLALQAGISTDLVNTEWNDLPSDAQAKIRDAGYVTSYEATEGQGGTYGRSDYMLNPQHEDITVCVLCGRNIDDHSNPNTDYRGMSGTAPATDHYFFGGDQGGSDDKYDFESIATESEWRVHTLTHGEIPITLGEQADEIDAVNSVKRMYFPEGFIPENEILSVVKIGESLHGYGKEEVTDEEDIGLLSRLLDNELEEEEQGDDETEDIALIAQLLGEEEFKEEEHPRDKGKFTSKGGGDSGGKHADTSTKDLIKSIKGGNKDWHAWGRTEKNEELYAEMEKRNREVPKPTSKLPDKVFRDDPDAVSKMEKKVKYWEDQKEYWNKITKFPSRDYQTPNQLGDAKWFMGTNISTNLRDANKKLEGIKAQQGRGTDLVRKPTYKDGKKRFYYSEEPKGEPAEEPWQKGGEAFADSDRPVSPNSLMRYTEPIDLPTGKNAMDQTYGVSEPETPDGQDLTGITVGEAESEYDRIRGLIEMSEMPETVEDVERWAVSWGADKDLVKRVFEQEFGTYEGDEEIIEQKPYKPTYHYYKQHPFGRRAGKQNPFGEATPKIFQTFNSLQGATEQVSIDTMNQAHIWWDNKYPERQWSDMRIGDRQHAILAFLRDPDTTLNEGGTGSGRKPTWKSEDPKTKEKHHIGWKNYGIDDYLDKAEKDYKEGKEQFEDPTPWVSIGKLALDTAKDIVFPAKEEHSFSDMTDKEMEELGDLESTPHQADEDTPMNAGKVNIKKIAKNKTLITPAEEGGKGSGKKDHKDWMRAIEEEHTYDFCENCSMVTEQINHKCDMCGKKVE